MKESQLKDSLKLLAPGTPLRDALDNVVRAKTGGLIVIDDSPKVMRIVEGGFDINAPFTPAALYELAKMDGAIILSSDAARIIKANAHLVPQAAILSRETGIRHRVANRVAQQTGALVIAISERRSVITLYKGQIGYTFREIGFVLTKANQAVQSLEKYKLSMEKTLVGLSLLEFDDAVSLHDVLKALQKADTVRRIIDEIESYILLLGSEGRLIEMQLNELAAGVVDEELMLISDYMVDDQTSPVQLLELIGGCSMEEMREMVILSRILGYGGTLSSLDTLLSPRGYRMLFKLPRIPRTIIHNMVHKFELLKNIIEAKLEELVQVEGVGEVRAKAIKEGMRKLKEQMLLEY